MSLIGGYIGRRMITILAMRHSLVTDFAGIAIFNIPHDDFSARLKVETLGIVRDQIVEQRYAYDVRLCNYCLS